MSAFANDIPREVAHAAHALSSFVPERRAEQERESYAAQLERDLSIFEEHGRKGGTSHLVAEEFARYREGVASKTRAYLLSQSRCASTMITGASNFPVARNQKRLDVAHRRLEELIGFQERARAAIIRTLRPDLAPIMAGADDAVSRLAKEIEKAERLQEIMKACNATIRKHLKAGKDAQVAALVALGHFGEGRARDLLTPDCMGGIGFAAFELTNNGANIRRMKARLTVISAAKSAPVTETANEETGIRVEDDPPANRVRLIFPGKPPAETRAQLKSHGFRWAPTSGAWQAYRNHSALSFAATFAVPASARCSHGYDKAICSVCRL